MWVPRWRTRIVPAVTTWPAYRLTPSRLAAESRPLRLEEAPFLWAMSVLLLRAVTGRGLPLLARQVDLLDLEPVQRLAVALGALLAGLVLVGVDADLPAAVLVHDRGGDECAGQVAGLRGHRALVVDPQQRCELDAGAIVAGEPLDVDDVADLDLVLLPAGADDGVHVATVLSCKSCHAEGMRAPRGERGRASRQ